MDTDVTTPATHGTKRSAEDGLEGEQRLSKRFNLLNLEHNGKLYIPVNHDAPHKTPRPVEPPRLQNNNQKLDYEDDWMQVEDTRDKVYIHNLDDELSSEQEVAPEKRIVFLPDIERQLAKIPEHILRGDAEPPRQLANELVLYSVPRSITVSEDKDNVRKAIIESRARARQEAQERADIAERASQDAMLHDDERMDMQHNQTNKDNDDAMDTE